MSTVPAYKKFLLPDWSKSLPNTAMINATDLSKAIGYVKADAVYTLIERKHLPPPQVFKPVKMFGEFFRQKKRIQWQLGTLRKFIKDRDEQSAKEKNP